MMLSLETTQPPRPFSGGVLPKPLSSTKPNAGDPSIAVQLSPPPPGSSSKDKSGNPHGPTHKDKPREAFHVFTWRVESKASELDNPSLHRLLEEEHEFLSKDSGSHDTKAYTHARTETRERVYKFLEVQSRARSEIPLFDLRVDLLNSADLVFQFFLPLQAQLPTVGKFWGSIMTLVQGQESPEYIRFSDRRAADINLEMAARRLEAIAGSFDVFRWMLSFASDEERADIRIPAPLSRAWLHIVMGLVHATLGGPSVPADDFWQQHLDVAQQYMQDGMRTILDGLTGKPLIEYAAVRPMELLALVSLGLIDDMSGKYTNITDTYEIYLRALETDIDARASPSHQTRINNVKAEIYWIKQTLRSQLQIFTCLQRRHTDSKKSDPEWSARRLDLVGRSAFVMGPGDYYGPPTAPPPLLSIPRSDGSRVRLPEAMPSIPLESFNRISSTMEGGLRGLIFSDGVEMLERKGHEFEEYTRQAHMLEESNTARIDVTRDRQERATYAFTVVTIIFLPLSAVASVFGINTSDIRDMNEGQWLYWVVAVPVTVLVIVIGLWWMGELMPMLDWCLRSLGLGNAEGRYWNADGAGGGSGVLLSGDSTKISGRDDGDSSMRTKPTRKRTSHSDSTVRSRWSKKSRPSKRVSMGGVSGKTKDDETVLAYDTEAEANDDQDTTIQEQVRIEVARVLERQRQEQLERRVLDTFRQRQRLRIEEEQEASRLRAMEEQTARAKEWDQAYMPRDRREREPDYMPRDRRDREPDRARRPGERERDPDWDKDRNRDRDWEPDRVRRPGDRARDTDWGKDRNRERERGRDSGEGRVRTTRRFRPSRLETSIVERHTDEMESEAAENSTENRRSDPIQSDRAAERNTRNPSEGHQGRSRVAGDDDDVDEWEVPVKGDAEAETGDGSNMGR